MDQSAFADLLAKQEITEAIYKYCRAMDRMDSELGRSVFHPDAIADYGEVFQGTGHGFVDFVYEIHAGLLVHQHQIGNILIHVEGDRAFSESYVTVTVRSKALGGSLVETRSCGRYVDRWAKRADRWAISHRTYVHEIDETAPVHNSRYSSRGRRDKSDPSYGAVG